ncbi:MAG: hypothetical protein IKQ97_08365 [Eubacterium sp.]|nr:hypothetical protein [Eubacterium sp.]
MFRTSQTAKRKARLIAMSMTLALAVPQTVVTVSNAASAVSVKAEATAEAATGSAAAAEELRTLIRGNLLKDYDAEKDGEMDIVHKVRNNNADDALTVAAQNVASQKAVKSAKYALYDINKDDDTEMFLRFDGKKKNTVMVYRYDTYDFSVACLGEYAGVSNVYKNTKKKQIVIVTAPSKKKKTITTYKIASSGKLKAASTYKQSGKTYKNGSKKISKNEFNKFEKSVKKMPEIKFGSIPKDDYSYEVEDECFYGKGIYWRSVEDEVARESFFMTVGDSSVAPQDKYLAYSYSYDLVGWHEYSSEPGLTRYVFGPSVADPKTGKTYQQEDWEAMGKEIFGGQYAPPFMTESVDENGKTVLDIEADGELHGVDVTDKQAKNGSASYKGKEYTIEYGDCQLRMLFIAEGPLQGRIAEAGIYYPHVTGEIAHDKWEFIYAAEAGNPAEHDPVIYDQITAGGVTEGSKPRTLKVGAATDELKQTIKANENVRFELYSGGVGQFYTTGKDGKETLLPLLPSMDDKGNKTKLSEEDKAWIAFENALNPANGQMTYGDPKPADYVSWKVKTNG